MSNNNTLTPLQKATICVNEADSTSNLSDMLVACQFILGCYNSKQEQPTRLKEKLSTKFTPAQQITEPPKQKISFGNQKGLDIATIKRLQPNLSTKRVTPGVNCNKSTPYPVIPPKIIQKPTTTTTTTSTFSTTTPAQSNSNYFTNKNVNYNAPPSNPNPPTFNKPQNTKPTVTQDPIPAKVPVKRKFDDDDEEDEETPKEDPFTTAKEKYVC